MKVNEDLDSKAAEWQKSIMNESEAAVLMTGVCYCTCEEQTEV